MLNYGLKVQTELVILSVLVVFSSTRAVDGQNGGFDAGASVLLRVYRDGDGAHYPRNTIGTGFFARGAGIPDGTIVTCYSVIRDAAFIRARLSPNDSSEFVSTDCHVVVEDPVHDLALLRVHAPVQTHNPMILSTVNLPSPAKRDDLLLVGPPSGGAKGTVHRGTLLSATRPLSGIPTIIRGHQKLPITNDPINDMLLYEVETTWSSATTGAPVVHADTGSVIAVLWFSAQSLPSAERHRYYCIPVGYIGNLDFSKTAAGVVNDARSYRNRELPDDTLQAANAGEVGIGSETLGTISPRTYLRYADDDRAFYPFEERGQWNIFAEGPYTELANKKFHFGVLVPDRTKISEQYDEETATFAARYQTPEDRTVTLTSKVLLRVPQSPRGELLRQLRAFRRHNLRLEIVGSTDRDDGFRGGTRVIFGNFLSHDIYRLGPQYVRTLRHYQSTDSQTSHIVIATISRDIFTTMHMEFPTSEWRPNAELPLLRQCFIAASLSSVAWASR